MFRILCWFVICFVLIQGSPGYAQGDFSDVKITTTHVAGTVYMLEGAGGNIGVSAGEDGLMMIDDQFAPLAEKIQAALKEINSGDLRFLLNTHWHGDHTGGNEFFGKGATIIAHDNVRERLTTEQLLFGKTRPPKEKDGWPVITFESSVSIYFNGEEIKLMHKPNAHTDGDAAVFFSGSNVVHTGDLLFSGMFPFVDLDHGGNVMNLIQTVEQLLVEIPEDARIIPGHGPLSGISELKAYHRMLIETTGTIRDMMDAGQSLEQIKDAGLGAKWESWAWDFISEEKWIEIVHASLSS
jgi:glyoxylase-like metal-dependent hydrolase (beta-lactamase superfamily II)